MWERMIRAARILLGYRYHAMERRNGIDNVVSVCLSYHSGVSISARVTYHRTRILRRKDEIPPRHPPTPHRYRITEDEPVATKTDEWAQAAEQAHFVT